MVFTTGHNYSETAFSLQSHNRTARELLSNQGVKLVASRDEVLDRFVEFKSHSATHSFGNPSAFAAASVIFDSGSRTTSVTTTMAIRVGF